MRGQCVRNRPLSSWQAWLLSTGAGGIALLLTGCATTEQQPRTPPPPAPPVPVVQWQEEPVPDGPWRPHLLKRCRGADILPPLAEQALNECWDLWSNREGSDAIMVLELHLQDNETEGLVLLALAQLYLLAGQGVPRAMPREGPAADLGDWPRSRARVLDRAEFLLKQAVALRPDDGAVEYLLADVARARGDSVRAQRAQQAGLAKCSQTRSFELLRQYQELNLYQPKGLEPAEPVYPEEASRTGLQGKVVLDLLISPAGEVLQVESVASPGASLTAAAAAALRQVRFAPARVGKYPIWSWYRVPVQFRLSRPDSEPAR